ncbi:unnamed protein product [Amaranthus hypochondriacus]
MAAVEEQVKDMQNQMEELKNEMNSKFDLLLSKLNERNVTTTGNSSRNVMEEHGDGSVRTKNLAFMPKLEFPKFDGTRPNEWISKASKYFELCKIIDEQKVDLASLHMVDKAAVWVAGFLAIKPMIGWVKFSMAVRARSFLEMHDYDLSPRFILDSFISGLKETIKPFVKAFKPDSLTQAIEYARLQEETKIKAEKIAKGLCYLCDKPYTRGHKCGFKEPQLFTIEVLADDKDEGNKMMDDEYDSYTMKEPCISLHALTGEQTFHTMKIVGFVKNKPLHILVDSGSTHNFLDIEYAKKLGCELEQIPPQEVTH